MVQILGREFTRVNPISHPLRAPAILAVLTDDRGWQAGFPIFLRFFGSTFQHSLHRGGYRVEVAVNGDEALRLARELKPDAITLDILMPQMDGWAVLAALKEDPELEKIPVTMLSIVEDRRIVIDD